ncbi:MAG TPA: TetR/AcrR family transcriptional regulator, partial [Deltaproteobacteria bacterium]|nr:TetR/AcrR family transcriptional regulator [Deltaproteobacteria bacterium]HQO80147.1 TetR/AcrR family transcriptional regulator [Deltaproteobacteria bacterium]
ERRPAMTRLSEIKRHYTRETIIEAAEELFSRHGYHNTQVIDIVRSVGMSAGTFYNYFRDKRDLFHQITRESFEDLRMRVKRLREPLNIWDSGDRRTKLIETFTEYFDYIDSHRQQFLILLRGSFGVDEELDGDVWNYHSGMALDLAEDLKTWLEIGIIEGLKPLATAFAVVGMAMHLGHSYVMERKITRRDAVDTLTSMCMAVFDMHMTRAGIEAAESLNGKEDDGNGSRE